MAAGLSIAGQSMSDCLLSSQPVSNSRGLAYLPGRHDKQGLAANSKLAGDDGITEMA